MATSTDSYPNRYARAFLEALSGLSESDLQKVSNELRELSVFSESPTNEFLVNPIFEAEEKKAVVESICEKSGVREETKQFLFTLLMLGHLHWMKDIAEHFSSALDEKNQQTRIEVRTAYALSEAETSKIKAALEGAVGKKVLLDIQIDPELIGGIRAQVGGVVYDSSIRGHLLTLQKEFEL